ncbi:MAG TPA: helix-turn-helix transcriptional regulator [Streptosporangiaceae bacterium]|nr:helix-turn-helix transcriptional regulator [Streptosporangiaceae bacterium]
MRGTWSAGPGDDQARFLADLRALRDSAAIGHDELAARAHYPSDVLKEAENGPSLPGLPILTAYVRACDGDVLDWEERWRRLNPEAPNDPDLPVRPAGASPAAQAGARAGVGVAPPDVYDPERIKAALRGGRARTEHGDRRASDPGVLAPASTPGGTGLGSTDLGSPDPGLSVEPGTGGDGWGAAAASTGWDPAPDPGVTTANGNHSATAGNRGPFDAAFTSLPEAAEPAAAEEFSWLQQSEPESRPAGGDGDLGWTGQTANGGSAEPADRSYEWSGRTESALPRHEDPDVTERFLRHQAEGLATREQTDFWGQPLPQAPADLRIPAATPRAEEPAVTRTSWTAGADITRPVAEPAHRTATVPAHPASAQQVSTGPVSTGPLGTSVSQTQAAARQRDHRQDRYFPARLLAVIVIAALIGSALVLLLK